MNPRWKIFEYVVGLILGGVVLAVVGLLLAPTTMLLDDVSKLESALYDR